MLIYEEETGKIIKACMNVYNELGNGFLEAVYQESFEEELKLRGIPFEAQSEIKISYKGKELRQFYKADIVCYGKIILELKAVSNLLPEHSAQLFNYLRATKMKLGLLVNFGHYPGVEIKRIAL
jgi:GxxExxY protein